MHPLNAINQDFTRVVVAEWSEEAQTARLRSAGREGFYISSHASCKS